jgi:hypothetical protein
MSVRQRWYWQDPLFGMRYSFPKAGEGLRRHSHLPELQHNVIVLRGAVSINGNVFSAGEITELGAEEHDVTAVEDYTETLHMFYNGIPSGYAELPESEHDVEI